MSQVVIEKSTLNDIADAINETNGQDKQYKAAEMAPEIDKIRLLSQANYEKLSADLAKTNTSVETNTTSISNNTTAIANLNSQVKKMAVVDALPAVPDATTLYFIKEV